MNSADFYATAYSASSYVGIMYRVSLSLIEMQGHMNGKFKWIIVNILNDKYMHISIYIYIYIIHEPLAEGSDYFSEEQDLKNYILTSYRMCSPLNGTI